LLALPLQLIAPREQIKWQRRAHVFGARPALGMPEQCELLANIGEAEAG
jgi:hypothetical protein